MAASLLWAKQKGATVGSLLHRGRVCKIGVFFAATSKDVAKSISCRWEIVDAEVLAQFFGNFYFVVF